MSFPGCSEEPTSDPEPHEAVEEAPSLSSHRRSGRSRVGSISHTTLHTGSGQGLSFTQKAMKMLFCFSLIQTIALAASPNPCHAAISASPTDVHQLVQLRAATLIHVPAALVALVHQLPQQLDHVVRCFLADLLKLEHSRSLAVHVLSPLVQFEDEHLGRKGMETRKKSLLDNPVQRKVQLLRTCISIFIINILDFI